MGRQRLAQLHKYVLCGDGTKDLLVSKHFAINTLHLFNFGGTRLEEPLLRLTISKELFIIIIIIFSGRLFCLFFVNKTTYVDFLPPLYTGSDLNSDLKVK